MKDAYEKALRDGLESLGLSDPTSEEFRNFIFKAGDSFRAGLEKRDPPLDAAAAEREWEAFGAAVEAVVMECMNARSGLDSSGEQQPAQNESVAPTKAGTEDATEVKSENRPDYSREQNEKIWSQYKKDHPVKAALTQVGNSFTMLFLIAVPMLAIASPLFTPVMAWGESASILIAGAAIVALALVPVSLSGALREGFGISLFFGALFCIVSFPFHNFEALRNFVEDDPSFLAMIADTTTESYFTVADWAGIGEPEPGEPRLTTAERRQAFQQEVETWLDK